MTTLTQLPAKTNFDDRQITMRVEAQGGLFALALDGEASKSTLKSCYDDIKLQRKHAARIWQNYQADFSFEKSAIVFASGRQQANTSMEAQDMDIAIISDEAREVIAREAADATWRELHGAPKRKQIIDFSRKSRLRLIKLVSRLNKQASGLFLTFTYRANMQDHTEAKKHLDLLLRWFKYNYPQGAFLWRMEYQQRGAIHFHVIAFNVDYIDIENVTKYWQALTGDDSYPDVEKMHNRRKALYYVSKYLAKHEKNAPAGFINEPYSEKPAFYGRFWGVVNRKLMPFAPRTYMHLHADAKVFHDLRRYGRKHYPKLSKRLQGFCLLVEDAQQWVELMSFIERSTDHMSGWIFKP